MNRDVCHCQHCQKERSRLDEFRRCLSNFDRLEGWRKTHSNFRAYCLDKWNYCPLDFDVETLLINSRKRMVLEWGEEEDDDEDF
jgi:hypothetical protein